MSKPTLFQFENIKNLHLVLHKIINAKVKFIILNIFILYYKTINASINNGCFTQNHNDR